MKEFKVVILGPGGVGKSALTVQFISGKFVERYDPTVEDFYRKEIEVDGDPAILEILDTAGTEQFASMRDLYIKNGQGFIIVYSLTSKQSFQDIRLIREQILRVKGTNRVPIVLAANKCDIVGPQREVSSEDGLELAAEWNIPYVETSAKNSLIVNSLFTEIVKEMNLKTFNSYGHTRKEKKKLKKLSAKLAGNVNPAVAGNRRTLFSNNSSSYASSLKDSTINNSQTNFNTNTASSNTSASLATAAVMNDKKKFSYLKLRCLACFECCCLDSPDDVYTKNSKYNASNNNIISNNDSFNERDIKNQKLCNIL